MRIVFFVTLFFITATAPAQVPSSVDLEAAREYKVKLVKMWADRKFPGCEALIRTAEANKFEVATTSDLLKSGKCNSEASFTQECFNAFDSSNMAKAYMNVAKDKCSKPKRATVLPPASSVCNPAKNSKRMDSLRNNTWCKQEVSCSNGFSIAGKDFDKGDYSFFCKPDEVGKCPNSFFGCGSISHTSKKGFMGIGGGEIEATGAGAQ